MDAVTVGAVLLAILGGVGGTLGGQLWAGVSLLVRRPFHHLPSADNAAEAGMRSGSAELAALEQAPDDRDRAVALAEVLLARANADAEFRRQLEGWWERSAPIRTGEGDVKNVISGGSQYGAVVQGRDFAGLTISGVAPVPPEPGQST